MYTHRLRNAILHANGYCSIREVFIIDNWILKEETLAKSRKYYAHFDCRTDMSKVREKVTNQEWVARHGFYPFIHYKKNYTKYSGEGKNPKKRDICYAAHIDRCILQYYCHKMNEAYICRIKELLIDDVPVAYRSDLGLNNIHLAKKAFDFIKANPNGYVMIGDFTGFFDYLDHDYLKEQWCSLLGMDRLPSDYYNIYKNITKYSVWELEDLLNLNGLPFNGRGRKILNKKYTVLSKEQFKKNRSHIIKHLEPFGIPQGSPISAMLANVYMMDVDQRIKEVVVKYSGKYMRYSDDFIIVLPTEYIAAQSAINAVLKIIKDTPGLILKTEKTQIYRINLPDVINVGELFLEQADKSKNVINFLGFTFNGSKVTLRAKTVSKYYYRMYRKAHKIALKPVQKGKDHLYEKYSERGAKITTKDKMKKKGNFFTYANRAEAIFGKSEEIKRPVKNHMARIRKALKEGRR